MSQLCTFALSGLWFGVEVEHVQEVVGAQPVTRVPGAPSVVDGLINLRGQIVPALNLRRRLGLPAHAPARMNVVVRSATGPVSLLVDDIGDVIDVDAQAFEMPPDTLTGAARDTLRGAYKLDDRLVLLLDLHEALMVG